MGKEKNGDVSNEAITRRLDALIMLLIEFNKEEKTKINDTKIAKMLKAVGLTPTEIARIFGKKSATEVSMLLYRK